MSSLPPCTLDMHTNRNCFKLSDTASTGSSWRGRMNSVSRRRVNRWRFKHQKMVLHAIWEPAQSADCMGLSMQSADCMVCSLQTAWSPCRLILFRNFSEISGFPRESTSWQNYLTKRKITSVFLTMVIIRFLACNWGKQWQVCLHGMNGCCDELDSLLPKCPPSFSHNTTL